MNAVSDWIAASRGPFFAEKLTNLIRVFESADLSHDVGEVEFDGLVEGFDHGYEVTPQPFDLHEPLEDHLVEYGPQPDLTGIDFRIEREGLDVWDDQVWLVLIDGRDPGVELSEHPVGHESDHRSGLHAEKRRSEGLEHGTHLAE